MMNSPNYVGAALGGLSLFTFSCGAIVGWIVRNRNIGIKSIKKLSELGKCSHASVLAYKSILEASPEIANRWERSGQGKIVVQVNSEESLLKVAAHANELGLNAIVVRDAGRTQIAAGSQTVLAVGPGQKDYVDKVTGHLKLL